jgi:predicted transcriptional regulator
MWSGDHAGSIGFSEGRPPGDADSAGLSFGYSLVSADPHSKEYFQSLSICCMEGDSKIEAGSETVMNTDDTPKNIDLGPVTKIIASYVGNHTLAPDQLSALIVSVQQALRSLGKPAEVPTPRTPAVPVRRSVQHDSVVCLECGFKGKTLRRHLGTRHGLQIAEYLRRWDLPSDHPLTAPAYSEQRSTMAKELGLGRKRSRPRGRTRRSKA